MRIDGASWRGPYFCRAPLLSCNASVLQHSPESQTGKRPAPHTALRSITTRGWPQMTESWRAQPVAANTVLANSAFSLAQPLLARLAAAATVLSRPATLQLE